MVGAEGTQRLCLEDLTPSVHKNWFCLTYRFSMDKFSRLFKRRLFIKQLGRDTCMAPVLPGQSCPLRPHRGQLGTKPPHISISSADVTSCCHGCLCVSLAASEPQASVRLCAHAPCWSFKSHMSSGDGTRAPQARPAMTSPTELSPQTTPCISPREKCTGFGWEMPDKAGVSERKLGSIAFSCELQIYCQLLLMEHLRLQVFKQNIEI